MPIIQLRQPIYVDRSADFDYIFTWYTDLAATVPHNLTGAAAAEMRFEQNGVVPPTNLSLGSGLSISGVAGQIIVAVPGSTTATWNFTQVGFQVFVTEATGVRTLVVVGALVMNDKL